MENVKFLPWIGKNYQSGGIFNKRILVLGESFYCSEEQAVPHLADNVVNNYLSYRKGEDVEIGKLPTYLKFERSLFGYREDGDVTTPEDSVNIWNSIAFYNYLQVPMTGARESGTYEDYINAQKPFFEVLNELKPQLIIVWGVTKMYDFLPDDNWRWGEKIVVDGYEVKNGYYDLSNGESARIIFVYHPSTHYSWDWWHEYVIKPEI